MNTSESGLLNEVRGQRGSRLHWQVKTSTRPAVHLCNGLAENGITGIGAMLARAITA